MTGPQSTRLLSFLWRGILSVSFIPVVWLLFVSCSSIEKLPSDPSTDPSGDQVTSTHVLPVEIEDGQIRLRASVDGHEMRLLLDTGATHVFLSPEAATTAGIHSTDKLQVGGFGDQRGQARLGLVRSLITGPAVAGNVPAAIAPMPSAFEVDGFLGLAFLRRFVFRLDYERESVSFAALNSAGASCQGSSLALQDQRPLLTVLCEVDGIPAKLVVDTGAGQELILRDWFVKANGLRERYPKRLGVITGGGVFGATHGEIARVAALKLGDYTLTNVFAEFETQQHERSGKDVAGFVGAGILRRFNLTFHPTERSVCIEPNSHYSGKSLPPACVRTGMVCVPDGTRWVVRDVVPDSPASDAGVALGDQLLEINGVAVGSLSFWKVKQSFQAEPGTRVRLLMQSVSKRPREVLLTLRDLL